MGDEDKNAKIVLRDANGKEFATIDGIVSETFLEMEDTPPSYAFSTDGSMDFSCKISKWTVFKMKVRKIIRIIRTKDIGELFW